jgi:protein involved in temperature-dependent protein secretion
VLAILLTGCTTTMRAGDAGCSAYAEARLDRPANATVTGVAPDWAGWIADLDDRMTGTCR